MTVNVLFVGIAVADLEAALDWYERFLGGTRRLLVSDPEGNRIQLGEVS